MGKVTFVIGGARSGKSTQAANIARRTTGKVAFIATCKPLDREMKKRVRLHRKTRPRNWQCFEELTDLPAVLKKISGRFDCVIIDCLTLLVSNSLLEGMGEKTVLSRMKEAMKLLKKMDVEAVIVSNEVGLGIVPGNELARGFRDTAGRINQLVAEYADEVIFTVAGLSLRLK